MWQFIQSHPHEYFNLQERYFLVINKRVGRSVGETILSSIAKREHGAKIRDVEEYKFEFAPYFYLQYLNY